jgi:hypothetical protein
LSMLQHVGASLTTNYGPGCHFAVALDFKCY